MKRILAFLMPVTAFAAAALLMSCAKDVEMDFKKFVDEHVAIIEPLEKESALAYWQAALTGNEDDFNRYSEFQLKLEKVYTNEKDFEYVKFVMESGDLKDALFSRTADLLYLRYLGNQIDSLLLARIVDIGAKVENKFGVFRPEVGGEKITTNDVYRILGEENDSARRREVWEASKKVGRIVLSDLMELVGLRNEAARRIGFDNYYTMSLTLAEQSEEELAGIFAELEELSREPFLELKRELDVDLAERYGIEPEEIRPWHYHDPYFQEAPKTGGFDMDTYYKGEDPVRLAKDFYLSIGMPVEDILDGSDLYERDGKNPHAFCSDMDRRGDIRILANIKDNNYWMETILHELGHGVYDKYVDQSLPFILRKYPHLATTEASAMYFGRLSQNTAWMKSALGLGGDELRAVTAPISKSLRLKQLVFARWCQTMFHFERELYKNPDQDLNKLWWDIVERYQFVKRPEGRNEPDWAAKIHIVTSPVYYHNYMLGELIASQFHHYIVTNVLEGPKGEVDIYGKPEVGRYFIDSVYAHGDKQPWDKHIELATGEPLTARYFVQQFVKEQD